MNDGMVIGVILFVAGVLFGASGVFFLFDRFAKERNTLHQIIGRQQQELDALGRVFPEEEL